MVELSHFDFIDVVRQTDGERRQIHQARTGERRRNDVVRVVLVFGQIAEQAFGGENEAEHEEPEMNESSGEEKLFQALQIQRKLLDFHFERRCVHVEATF